MRAIKKTTFLILSLVFISLNTNAQSWKDKLKMPKKDNSASYECGYIHKKTLAEKLNPMTALQKGIGAAFTIPDNPDLGTTAITIYYQAHLHPQNIMRYPTKIPGWETCGDAVFAGFTNRNGMGLSGTDGKFMLSDSALTKAGIGSYFQGFSPDLRGDKKIQITSSNGDKIDITIGPAKPLSIISIDGKAKGEEIEFDGSKDIVVMLENGDADLGSKIHCQLICKLVGTPIIYDLFVSKASNKIIIPKEAFKNFEGSPSPFSKRNTLIVNRVNETVISNTDAGALRTVSAYMDWAPVSMAGDLAKGNLLTMGMDTTKNTIIKLDLETQGEYSFKASKNGPYTAPPIKLMKNVAIGSFLVSGNMADTKTTTGGGWITTTKKWFPQYDDATWEKLTEKMYADFVGKLEKDFGLNVLPMSQVVQSEAYKHIKPITDSVTQSQVEFGAGGSQRILTTRYENVIRDMGITFGSDFISERLIKELGVDAVIAVTVDLNFNYDTEGLDPVITIVAYAPMVSYKTGAQYFSMTASTESKSLADGRALAGSTSDIIYQMIKAESFSNGFVDALEQLSKKEEKYPVYEILWKAKL